MNRSIGLALLVLGAATSSARAEFVTVGDFSDILFWTGSGTNSAALVLQFPTTVETGTVAPTSIAWGHRWNGSATFADMLFSLAGNIAGGPLPAAGADLRLSVDVSYSVGLAGYFVNEIRYDQVGLPSPWSNALRIIAAYDPETGEYPAQYQLDAGNSQWSATPFDASQFGISGTPLVTGGWYGFIQADGSAGTLAFAQPVSAVPEPSGVVLLACGGAIVGTLAWRRRRQRAA
ncbi:MAG: hypothetical protein RLZZ21_2470 [Planctomycetota bacterium]|jgi:hypothetical protein